MRQRIKNLFVLVRSYAFLIRQAPETVRDHLSPVWRVVDDLRAGKPRKAFWRRVGATGQALSTAGLALMERADPRPPSALRTSVAKELDETITMDWAALRYADGEPYHPHPLEHLAALAPDGHRPYDPLLQDGGQRLLDQAVDAALELDPKTIARGREVLAQDPVPDVPGHARYPEPPKEGWASGRGR